MVKRGISRDISSICPGIFRPRNSPRRRHSTILGRSTRSLHSMLPERRKSGQHQWKCSPLEGSSIGDGWVWIASRKNPRPEPGMLISRRHWLSSLRRSGFGLGGGFGDAGDEPFGQLESTLAGGARVGADFLGAREGDHIVEDAPCWGNRFVWSQCRWVRAWGSRPSRTPAPMLAFRYTPGCLSVCHF